MDEADTPQQCRFIEATCHTCGKKGHISPACRSKLDRPKQPAYDRKPKRRGETKWVGPDSGSESTDESTDEMALYTIRAKSTPPIMITLQLNQQNTVMELDTGAAMSLISETTKQELFPELTPRSSAVLLKTYTGEPIAVEGEINVRVTYEDQGVTLPLLIMHQGYGS